MDSVINLEALKAARGERSQTAVAQAVGLTRQQIWNYETGASEPPLSVLSKLADLYEVPIERFLNQKNFANV